MTSIYKLEDVLILVKEKQLQAIFREKAIIFLYYIEELSIEEISYIENIAPQKIEIILNSIKGTFRNKFSLINFPNNNLMELLILISLTRSMQLNALSEKDSRKIYDNIISNIKNIT